MGDPEAAIAHNTTDLDLSWGGKSYSHEMHRSLLLPASRDPVVEDTPDLKARYRALAGDWEQMIM